MTLQRNKEDMKSLIECDAEEIWSVLGRAWALLILKKISKKDVTRFNEIKKAIPQISNTVLSDRLRELEEHNLIKKKVYAEVPIRVEYSLTTQAKSLGKILVQLEEWVLKHRKEKIKKK
ncbi:MAG: helix-turn-helix transcriptional regulator [Nitrosopumilus sp.]|uniref:winged helix-turn-helix transcriptional regulator n=1 Tax=Nitrosopumilus sp. TaxID=2024843 RepID=UPI00247D0EB5|nr:helix-turn-helix domain-containing protein [Nitrosopumilus sp.]MCV0392712.1 helix-turn-helix transcriptional regulator [Nitrosopumilus sp.]